MNAGMVSGRPNNLATPIAFYRQNVELLAQKMQDHADIVATAYHISSSDKSVIEDELGKAFEHEFVVHDTRIRLADMKCAQFFREYWRTLTAEKGDHEPMQTLDFFAPPSGYAVLAKAGS